MDIYYVYAYLRKNGTPYYIGKGKGNRAFSAKHNVKIPDDISKIVFLECNLSEIGAYALERRYIKWYGRVDVDPDNGLLLNRTNGGEGLDGNVINLRSVPNKQPRKSKQDIMAYYDSIFEEKPCVLNGTNYKR